MATTLPAMYQWLAKEPGPKMIVEALRLFGTIEVKGKKQNPTILTRAKEMSGKIILGSSEALSQNEA